MILRITKYTKSNQLTISKIKNLIILVRIETLVGVQTFLDFLRNCLILHHTYVIGSVARQIDKS